jgi:hypothetical protein
MTTATRIPIAICTVMATVFIAAGGATAGEPKNDVPFVTAATAGAPLMGEPKNEAPFIDGATLHPSTFAKLVSVKWQPTGEPKNERPFTRR